MSHKAVHTQQYSSIKLQTNTIRWRNGTHCLLIASPCLFVSWWCGKFPSGPTILNRQRPSSKQRLDGNFTTEVNEKRSSYCDDVLRSFVLRGIRLIKPETYLQLMSVFIMRVHCDLTAIFVNIWSWQEFYPSQLPKQIIFYVISYSYRTVNSLELCNSRVCH